MEKTDSLRDEFIRKRQRKPRRRKEVLEFYETLIIISAMAALTVALVSGSLTENTFAILLGPFFGYTFGRIFNQWQQ